MTAKTVELRPRPLLSAALFVLALSCDALLSRLAGEYRIDFRNPFWFVALLVIFGTALTLMALVFRSIDMSHRDEAFALPPGTIRTLLAVGIMVLFSVLGLRFFDPTLATPRTIAKEPIPGTVAAPPDGKALDDEIRRYRNWASRPSWRSAACRPAAAWPPSVPRWRCTAQK